MPVNFLIKHKSGGKFFHPAGGSSDPGDNTRIVLHPSIHNNMHWTFEVIEGHWGYIKHVSSGKIIHPYGGGLTPGNGTNLVLHSKRHSAALFALDAVNDYVIHKGGRYAHPHGGSPDPGDNTTVLLHSDLHDAMKFQFVATNDKNKEVLVYGNPTMMGQWKIINMVRNPMAEHKYTFEVKIGKSKTESRTTSFQYTWEALGGIMIKMLTASASQSLQFMMEKSSTETWSKETTQTREITVPPGKTVVTWQYVFDIQQNDSKTVCQSNMLADTDSETKIPGDVQHTM